MPVIQIPVIILPTVSPLGTETELVNDAVTHVSLELQADDTGSIIQSLYEKTVFVLAQEIVIAGAPGNLQIWIEESPYPTLVTPTYWGALGGGGGALPPVAFDVIAGTGVNGIVHTLLIHWNSYSPYARIVVQTPVPAAAAAWAIQIMFAGQGH